MGRGRRQPPAQHWDPERYQRNAGFVAVLGEPLLELLAPQPGERILDLGCGDGALTLKLAASGATVVAVDQSSEQVTAARSRGLDAQVADGARLEFRSEFDAVFSNAALHWMRDADAVIEGVFRALKPGGRFVGEMGGAGNVTKVLAAVLAALDRRGVDGRGAIPWYFPSAEEYREKLERRGFRLRTIELFPRPTRLPGHIGAWLETFGDAFLGLLAPNGRAAFLAEVGTVLEPALKDAEGWSVDYVRLRFAAEKPD